MLVAIKKYEFYITKTKFYKFIIKLKKLSVCTSEQNLEEQSREATTWVKRAQEPLKFHLSMYD